MNTILIIVIAYPILLAAWVGLDRLTGWAFADAYGKDVPK